MKSRHCLHQRIPSESASIVKLFKRLFIFCFLIKYEGGIFQNVMLGKAAFLYAVYSGAVSPGLADMTCSVPNTADGERKTSCMSVVILSTAIT